MVVVAIIGVLAAVAIPSFTGFQKRARASEAKTNLGSLYTAEKGYNYENNAYASTLADIGFGEPDGTRNYAIGFAGSLTTNYWGTKTGATQAAAGTRSDTVATTLGSTCAAATSTFKACATGTTNTESDYSIDEGKSLDRCPSLGC